ncbi:uncharacterized protein HMPREF1541_03427 [Cyphellophora europaea CBS 101466]|uniref:Heterokaryon incompatibility domain-containing protein n=1 Tax=Cyphellophora europaea (strain CBS 101466) TaxID=1220924 RepID=W2RYC0_CYPE1|nr:uncharacterized protein HMPREF1541_03427 [Cyphellophora europaea CBS 101466]ETN41491.1 hypothetical protein HMPREF1541_03427 [Cyphellophora europaea CBS 101466]
MATQECGPLVHAPLTSPDRQIRLLEVAALGDGDFDYSLTTYILGSRDIPHFYALSYEWGPAQPTYPITIDGQYFEIRENLKRFLDRIASGDRDFVRPLWIDAICIDQENVAERNEQVKIMGNIYSAASLVLTWIGSHHIENGALAETEVHLRDWEKTDEFRRLSTRGASGRPSSLSLQEPYGRMWNHLKLLCEQTYWHRLWILQELIKANKLLLLWGIEQITWQALSIAFRTIYEAAQTRRSSFQIQGPWDIVEQSIPFSVWLHTQNLNTKQRLLQTMETYRESKCSVNHDKAYALTGISSDAELLQVDYDKSLPDLYADLMGLEPRTPRCLRYSHLVLEALRIDGRTWANSSVRGRSVSCSAGKMGNVLATAGSIKIMSEQLIHTETWQLSLEAKFNNPDRVERAAEWAQKIYAELKVALGADFAGLTLFCAETGHLGVSLTPISLTDIIYRVQGLFRDTYIYLKHPGHTAGSGPDTLAATTRVWLFEEPLPTGQELRHGMNEAIDLTLADLFSMDSLLDIEFVIGTVPSSPTDEPPSPRLATRRAQSDTVERRRLHHSGTVSRSIDEAMWFPFRASTWPEERPIPTDGWYIEALARDLRDKLFTGTSPLNSPD